MKEYYLTFGTRYTFKEHPTLGYYPDLPDMSFFTKGELIRVKYD